MPVPTGTSRQGTSQPDSSAEVPPGADPMKLLVLSARDIHQPPVAGGTAGQLAEFS
jgi:hypothetical protein